MVKDEKIISVYTDNGFVYLCVHTTVGVREIGMTSKEAEELFEKIAKAIFKTTGVYPK